MKNNNRTDFKSVLQTLLVNVRFNSQTTYNTYGIENLPQIYFAFQLNNFSIKSIKEEFLVLRTLSLDAKLENNIVNLYFKLNTLNICYNHLMIHKWINTNFLQSKTMKKTVPEIEKSKELGLIEKLLCRCIINGCAELWYVSALLRMSEDDHSNASIGFDHTKLILEQSFENRGKILFEQ